MTLSSDVIVEHIAPCLDNVAKFFVSRTLRDIDSDTRHRLRVLLPHRLIDQALPLGYGVDMHKWLHRQKCVLGPKHLSLAYQYENQAVLEWMCEHLLPNYSTILGAIIAGDLEAVKRLPIPLSGQTKTKYFRLALHHDNLELLRYLHQHGFDCTGDFTFAMALKHCGPHVLDWFVEHGASIASLPLTTIKNLTLDKLQWLVINQYNFNYETLAALIEKHGTSFVDVVMNHGSQRIQTPCALLSGSVVLLEQHKQHIEELPLVEEVLQLCPISTWQWLKDHGLAFVHRSHCFFHWTPTRIDHLEWLSKVDPLFRESSLDEYSQFSIEALEFLHRNNMELPTAETQISSAVDGRLEKLQFFERLKSKSLDQVLTETMFAHGTIKELEWFRNMGYQVGHPQAMRRAIQNYNLDVMKWLEQQGCRYDGALILSSKTSRYSIEFTTWFLDHGFEMAPLLFSFLADDCFEHAKLFKERGVKFSLTSPRWRFDGIEQWEWYCQQPLSDDFLIRAAIESGDLEFIQSVTPDQKLISPTDLINEGVVENIAWWVGLDGVDSSHFLELAKGSGVKAIIQLANNKTCNKNA